MVCKYFLTIGDVKSEIDKADLRNWDEVEYSIKRSDFGGVVRSFSSSFEFVGVTAERITNELLEKNLYASAEIEVETIQNDWTFVPVFSCPLDFVTYNNDGGVVSIKAIDNSLAAVIKTNKNKKYEFLMSEMYVDEDLKKTMSDYIPFTYEGMELSNVVSFRVGKWNPHAMISEYSPTSSESQKIPVSLVKEDVIDSFGIEWMNQTQEDFRILTREELKKKDIFIDTDRHHKYPYGAETRGTNVFLVNTSNEKIRLYVNMELTVDLPPNLSMNDIDMYVSTAIGWESNEKHDGNIYDICDWPGGQVQSVSAKWIPETFQIVMKNQEFILYPGYKMMVLMRVKKEVQSTMKFTSCKFDVLWKTKTKASKLDYVRPKTLLSKIVKSMTEGRPESSRYGCRIESEGKGEECHPEQFSKMGDSDFDTRINHTILVSKDCINCNPDSIRYIKTSFSDFCKWMEVVFGYVYVIEGDQIVFRHRDKVFGDRVTKYIDFSNDALYKVNKKLVYSTLEIGYKGQDEGYNSKYEFNRALEYDTGINNTEKKMSLLSPYRADSVGFEMVYQKGLKENNDEKSSEEGIWCVYVEDTDGYGNNTAFIKVFRPSYMSSTYVYNGFFNVYLSPIYCLMANSKFLSGSVINLKLLTKELNDVFFLADFGTLHIVRDFVKENDDCSFFVSPLFTIGEFDFETNDCSLPVNLDLLVSVRWRDKIVVGYIKEITNKYEHVEQSRYTLIVKQIKES